MNVRDEDRIVGTPAELHSPRSGVVLSVSTAFLMSSSWFAIARNIQWPSAGISNIRKPFGSNIACNFFSSSSLMLGPAFAFSAAILASRSACESVNNHRGMDWGIVLVKLFFCTSSVSPTGVVEARWCARPFVCSAEELCRQNFKNIKTSPSTMS